MSDQKNAAERPLDQVAREVLGLWRAVGEGRWELFKRHGNWDWVVALPDGNPEICQLFHDNTEMNERGLANGRLICAARNSLPLIAQGYLDANKRATELQTVLDAWHSIFGSAQLTHASDNYRTALADRDRLAAENERMREALEVFAGIEVKPPAEMVLIHAVDVRLANEALASVSPQPAAAPSGEGEK